MPTRRCLPLAITILVPVLASTAIAQSPQETIDFLRAKLAEEKKRSAELNEVRNAERAELRAAYDKLRDDYADQREKTYETRKALQKELGAANERAKTLAARLEELERWQVDARLQSFDPKTGRGVVPLGSNHGVRRRLRFFVGRPKSEKDRVPVVEVVRVLGPESSEVRLLPGDEGSELDLADYVGVDLHAPWWSAGNTTKLAFAGRVDIGAPALSNDEKLPTLGRFLRSQGAEAVVAPQRFGGIDGELSDDVRVVVLGDFPDIATDRELYEESLELLKEAERRGIPIIQEDEFLARTGGAPLPLTEEDLEVLQQQEIEDALRRIKELEERRAREKADESE